MSYITINMQSPEVPDGTGPRIVSTPETCGGRPRVVGHRITVQHILLDFQRGGMSADEIVSAYPGLTLADVYAALAYYYANRERIDAEIRADGDHWGKIQAANPGALIDRLKQRKVDAAHDPLSS